MSEIINNEKTEGQTPEAQAEAPAEQQAPPVPEASAQAAPARRPPQQDAPRPQRTDYRDRPRGGPGEDGRRGSFYESKDRGDRESAAETRGRAFPGSRRRYASSARTRTCRLTTSGRTSSSGSLPTAARFSRGGSRAPAPGTSGSLPVKSSGRALSRCCPLWSNNFRACVPGCRCRRTDADDRVRYPLLPAGMEGRCHLRCAAGW